MTTTTQQTIRITDPHGSTATGTILPDGQIHCMAEIDDAIYDAIDQARAEGDTSGTVQRGWRWEIV